MRWHISVFSADGSRLLFTAQVADRKEAAALATEARRLSSSVRIYLRDPYGHAVSWD